MLVIFLTIAFNRKKVGLHDTFAKASVVDLSTVTQLKEEQMVDETKFEPTDESSIIELPQTNDFSSEQFPGINVDDFIELKKDKPPESNSSTEIDLVLETNPSSKVEPEKKESLVETNSSKVSDSDIKNLEK